jgi:hypothetical protein
MDKVGYVRAPPFTGPYPMYSCPKIRLRQSLTLQKGFRALRGLWSSASDVFIWKRLIIGSALAKTPFSRIGAEKEIGVRT